MDGTGRPAIVAGVLLAAGEGSRLGGPKALVAYQGNLLVDRAVATLRDGGCDPVIVVLGAAAEEIRNAARLEAADVVINDRWLEGMASSVLAGMRAADARGASAAVIALVDQPGITAAAVQRLVNAWRDGASAVVATYAGEPRNPVVLDRSLWPEVAASLHGDDGARSWLRTHPEQVTGIPCDDVASPFDIDTPRDLDTARDLDLPGDSDAPRPEGASHARHRR